MPLRQTAFVNKPGYFQSGRDPISLEGSVQVDKKRDDRRMIYCARLGVAPTATLEEIQRAYRELALQYHPERNPGRNTTRIFIAIQEAYEGLTHQSTLPWMGLYHTPWSIFNTTHGYSKSPRDKLHWTSSGFFIPLSAISTVFYLFILVLCYFLTLSFLPLPQTENPTEIHNTVFPILFFIASFLYGLTLFLLFVFCPKE